MSKPRSSPPKTVASIEVRATRYDLVKVRLGQVLVPIALIVLTIARRFGSTLALIPAGIPMVAALWALLSARKSSMACLVAHPGRVEVGASTIQAGELGRWRWHGAHATLFAPGGNIVIRATSLAETEALRVALEEALGSPLAFRRRGSLRARVGALVVAAVGVAVLGIGVVRHLVYLTPAIIPVIVGLATFATLSGRVADPSR